MCRSGRTSRCVSAAGRDVPDRDEAVGGVHVVAVRDQVAEEAVRLRQRPAPPRRRRRPPRPERARRSARRRATACSRRRSRAPGDRRERRPCSPPGSTSAPGTQRPTPHGARALRSLLTCRGTGSSAAVRVPGRGEYGKTCTLRDADCLHRRHRIGERALVLGREADDHVGREVEVARAARCGSGTARSCSGVPSRAARRRRPTAAGREGAARRRASRASPR